MQQNRTILAVDDDNFTDIAIRYTQNAENAFLLAELNGMNVDDIIPSGTEILIPAKSEAPVIFVQKKVTEIEPTTSALLELQKKHSATVATAQQLGHVRSGSQIRVKEDGTMEVIGGIGKIQDATDVDTTAIADDKILVAKAITGGFKHVYEDKPTNGGGKEWQLQFFNQTDIIQVEATSVNIAIFASGVGTDVGSIEVSTDDGVTYTPLVFPFSPSVGTLYFKRSINSVTGVYTISELWE